MSLNRNVLSSRWNHESVSHATMSGGGYKQWIKVWVTVHTIKIFKSSANCINVGPHRFTLNNRDVL